MFKSRKKEEMNENCYFYRPRYWSKCCCLVGSIGFSDIFASSKFNCENCPHKNLDPISLERRYESEIHFGNS